VRFPARALAGLVILASSITLASAQGTPPSNSQVEIEYIRPQKREYLPIHDRLKNRKVLEQLQQFLSPLRLPQKLTIKIDQCGAPSRPYKSDGVATICYEIVEQIERAASGLNGEARSSAIAGAFIQATMYQVSVAVLDILDFPIWGRTGDAADRLSAFVMQNFGEDLAIRTVIATARFFEATRRTWTGSAFASADSPEEQRFYNYLCIAYGGSPISFRFLDTETGRLQREKTQRLRSDEAIRPAADRKFAMADGVGPARLVGRAGCDSPGNDLVDGADPECGAARSVVDQDQ
jgi:hypothetical protein